MVFNSSMQFKRCNAHTDPVSRYQSTFPSRGTDHLKSHHFLQLISTTIVGQWVRSPWHLDLESINTRVKNITHNVEFDKDHAKTNVHLTKTDTHRPNRSSSKTVPSKEVEEDTMSNGCISKPTTPSNTDACITRALSAAAASVTNTVMTSRHNAPDVSIQTTLPVRTLSIKAEKDDITFDEGFSTKKRGLESDDQNGHVKRQCTTATAIVTTPNTSTNASQPSAPSPMVVQPSSTPQVSRYLPLIGYPTPRRRRQEIWKRRRRTKLFMPKKLSIEEHSRILEELSHHAHWGEYKRTRVGSAKQSDYD